MHQWSTTPINNQTADPRANWQEGQAASSLNNSARGMMASAALWRDDNLGLALQAVQGANNSYTITTGQGLIDPTSIAAGGTPRISHSFSLRVAFPNAPTGMAANPPKLAIDGAAAATLTRADGTPLVDGDIVTTKSYLIIGSTFTGGALTGIVVASLLPSDIAALIPPPTVPNACRLVFTSATQVVLAQSGGTKIMINGAAQTIPTAGVPLSNAGLSANTLYYLYAFMSGTTPALTLEAVTTPPAVDPATGAVVKGGGSPDTTRTLVGAALTTASSTFQGGCGTLSYHNRRDLATGTGSFTLITGSGQWTLLQGSVMYGLAWADEAVDAEFTGCGGITAQNAGVYANMRAVIGDVGLTTPQILGPQSKSGGNNFVIGGLASRVVQSLGAVTPFAVWAQGFGDASQQVAFTLAGTLKTRG